jgi:alginate O-acetyltransferase complex protein AlgJ
MRTLNPLPARRLPDLLFSATVIAVLCAPGLRLATRTPGLLMERASQGHPHLPALRQAAKDSIFFHTLLVRANAHIRVGVLGASTSPRVIMGRSGWRFYSTDVAEIQLRGSPQDPRVAQWATNVQNANAYCTSKGIPYLLLVCPNKATMHPEQLPSWLEPSNLPSRMDLLFRLLKGSVPQECTPDIRPLLASGTQMGSLYYRTDTHWNALGATLAMKSVLDGLHRTLPMVEEMATPKVLRWEARTLPTDLDRLLGLPDAKEDVPIIQDPVSRAFILTPGASLPLPLVGFSPVARLDSLCPTAPEGTLLVFRDSFGHALIEPLSRRFRRVVYLWRSSFDPSIADEVRPTAIIQQLVERRLFQESPGQALDE